ncbi:lipid asymmetry maintenance protein MlaB [Hydrogenophaga sp.]|uniref:STAS domain-containing protein n=1 Tax=Hydrogenophaga sp. TaxID=1904254 RepID=UPI00271F27E7|nr:STAS domain-containing protein [Hydrogenophaga sp.]MDO9135655.1 STAS domain-containing protein [Hydrogenophaga sp.]MDO9604197.1 STAS domain-containing protein [Hydrogenophaga sp.]MDP3477886.1 STAS domain-containing protein [Hydrogenophaga sp.]
MQAPAVHPSGAAAVAALPEQITMHVAVQVLGQLSQTLAQQQAQTLVLDAQALRVFDSSAVAVLLELRRATLARGKALRLVHLPTRLQQLVTLYGVSELLPA